MTARVVVIGGGIAGCAAAVAAARSGAQVQLLEAAHHLGGVAVRGEHRTLCGLAAIDAVALTAYIVTQIQVDGTGEGPDVGLYRSLLAATDCPIVASGGVGSLDHIAALAALEVAGKRLDGVIVGRALYDGAFTLSQALAVAAGQRGLEPG